MGLSCVLFPAIRHVLAAKYAETEHFRWSEFWSKLRIEVASNGFDEVVPIAFLHLVVDHHGSFSHWRLSGSSMAIDCVSCRYDIHRWIDVRAKPSIILANSSS